MSTDNTNNLGEGFTDSNEPNLKFLTASSIIGDKVSNAEGEKLGHIKDIMLNIRSGKIEYYVIDFGGFLGIGEKYFAIPANKLEIDPDERDFRFNEKRETLEKAPGFDKHHWPETNEHKVAYTTDVWSFWGDD
ncbi:MAG: PRC-barrel domain-containing protein [Chitinophagaceae bacterium]|nr:PRC-barrel domain-containing protein [Bacteroidota bacterium]MCC6258508.1 PRC-barrel domain-containing protein [Chitinophagaceae bacterium]